MPQYCFCRRGADRFMIFCDRCNIWFHGECVGITAKRSKTMDEWFCTWCSLSKKAEEVLQKNCLAMIRKEISQSLQAAKTSDDQLLLINELRAHVKKLEEENKRIQMILLSKEQKENSLELLIDELKTTLGSKEQEILSLKTQVKKLEEEYKNIQLISLSKEQKENSRELLIDELKTTLGSKEQEILSLKNHVKKLEDENKNIQLISLSKKQNSLELPIDELKFTVEAKKEEILHVKHVGNQRQDFEEISRNPVPCKKSRLSLSQQKKKEGKPAPLQNPFHFIVCVFDSKYK